MVYEMRRRKPEPTLLSSSEVVVDTGLIIERWFISKAAPEVVRYPTRRARRSTCGYQHNLLTVVCAACLLVYLRFYFLATSKVIWGIWEVGSGGWSVLCDVFRGGETGGAVKLKGCGRSWLVDIVLHPSRNDIFVQYQAILVVVASMCLYVVPTNLYCKQHTWAFY